MLLNTYCSLHGKWKQLDNLGGFNPIVKKEESYCTLRQLVFRLFYSQHKVPKYEGRTESHEQFFLHANWEQQTKESAMVDGTNCCVILECLVTSIACIT